MKLGLAFTQTAVFSFILEGKLPGKGSVIHLLPRHPDAARYGFEVSGGICDAENVVQYAV